MLSPLAMAEWIEIFIFLPYGTEAKSPLAMAEWIEITMTLLITEYTSRLR